MPSSLRSVSIVICLGCLLSLAYVVFFVQRATVDVDLTTSRKTIFKIYWRQNGEPWTEQQMSRIVIRPNQEHYTFHICNLAGVNELRIDTSEKPATVTLKRLRISQHGYPDILLKGDALRSLRPREGIADLRLDSKGLSVVPSNQDPQLSLALPEGMVRTPAYSAILVRIGCIFLVVWLLTLVLGPLAKEYVFVPYLLTSVLVLVLVMAGISRYNRHPDEFVHINAAEYYMDHTMPPRIGAPEIRYTYSDYGVSRLHSGEFVYFLVGKFMQLVRPLHLRNFFAYRLFNVLLFFVLLLLALTLSEYRLLLLPVLISPQIWYIYSYANSDGFALFILLLLAYQVAVSGSMLNRLIEQGIGKKDIPAVLFLAILFGLSLMVKKNFYFFHVFVVSYFCWRLVFLRPVSWRVFARRLAVIMGGALVFFGVVRAADIYVNGFDTSEQLFACRQKFATRIYNPDTPLEKKHVYLQMKDRGVTLKRLLLIERWGEKSFRTSFGVYGYTTISASFTYYDLVRVAGLCLLAFLVFCVLVRGGLAGTSLLLLTLGTACALLAVALYHAWTVDFQAQGRYFLPIVAMLAIFLHHGERYLVRPVFQLLVVAMYLLSTYNFIFVGLHDIAKFGN